MSGQRHVHLYGIAAAFAAVALLFATATAIVTLSTRAIDTSVAALRADALPSLDDLLEAQADLRQLVRATRALAESPEAKRSERTLALLDVRAAFDREMTTYLGVASDGEHDHYASQAPPRLHELDATLDRVRRAARDPAAVRRLQEELYDDVESVDVVLRELMHLNASQAQTAVRRIADAHRASIRLAPLLDAGSAVLAAIAAALAIHAAGRYAATMEHNAQFLAERAGELEVFDRRVAHDLLNPLSTVGLSMAAVAQRHPDGPTQELVRRATRALQRSRELVEGILAFARSGAHPSAGAQSDLREAVQAAVESVVSAEGTSPPETRVEAFDDVAVACENTVLVTMLTNLLSNAAKYTRGMPVRQVIVRPIVSRDRVRVEVQDTGPGFPPGMEGTLFDPYVRAPNAAQPGIGLGLATVKRFATAYGGAVGVRQLEQGSVFWFELPRAQASAVAAQAAPAPKRRAPWRKARAT
jgi:signal transduction histidine kinase